MSNLVERLCTSDHPVEIRIRPERTLSALKACLDRGFVHIRFTDTRGGTELGIPIDAARSDLSQADLERGAGSLRLVGALTLDYVPVRCIADIDVSSFSGRGRLETVDVR